MQLQELCRAVRLLLDGGSALGPAGAERRQRVEVALQAYRNEVLDPMASRPRLAEAAGDAFWEQFRQRKVLDSGVVVGPLGRADIGSLRELCSEVERNELELAELWSVASNPDLRQALAAEVEATNGTTFSAATGDTAAATRELHLHERGVRISAARDLLKARTQAVSVPLHGISDNDSNGVVGGGGAVSIPPAASAAAVSLM